MKNRTEINFKIDGRIILTITQELEIHRIENIKCGLSLSLNINSDEIEVIYSIKSELSNLDIDANGNLVIWNSSFPCPINGLVMDIDLFSDEALDLVNLNQIQNEVYYTVCLF